MSDKPGEKQNPCYVEAKWLEFAKFWGITPGTQAYITARQVFFGGARAEHSILIFDTNHEDSRDVSKRIEATHEELTYFEWQTEETMKATAEMKRAEMQGKKVTLN
jgi:hypothetical protein